MKNELTIGLSNRHCHLTEKHIEMLFGKEYKLTPVKDLTQPGQFACAETVDVAGPKGKVEDVRILGPARSESQVEFFITDCYRIGVPIVIRESGRIDNTPGAVIIGPKGVCELKNGVIVAARHIHMSIKDAQEFGVKDNDTVDVETDGIRGVIFKNVLIRSGEKYALDMHIDFEEGNAAGIRNGQTVRIVKRY